MQHPFDRNLDRLGRRRERQARLVLGIALLVWLGVAGAAFWVVTHPREVGEYIATVAATARKGAC